MLNAIIVDDEPLVLNLLKSILIENGVNIIGEYTKPEIALHEIPIKNPDIVFLDIEMPGMSGIELATELIGIEKSINIVFVTAFNQYAVDAFKLNAVHYLLKPSTDQEVKEVLARIEPAIRIRDTDMQGQINIRFFGGLSIVDATEKSIMNWPTTKTEELFALLFLNGEKGIDKWKIIEKLWPENDQLKIENIFYTTIYRMKKTLAEAGINAAVVNRRGNYTLNIVNTWCDIHAFENLYQEYKTSELSGVVHEEKLFSIYSGELFASKDYVWAELHRHYFSHKFEQMFEMIIESYIKSNDNKRIKNILIKKELIHQ